MHFPVATMAQETGGETLDQAEQALINIDFEKAGQLAEKALRSGQLSTPEETSRARYLVGIGYAFAENIALAKEHFRTAIAINPDLPVDSSLGPKLQSPFLEARGELAVRKEFLDAEATIAEGTTGPVVSIKIKDPARTAKTVDVGLRPHFYESDSKRALQWTKVGVEKYHAEAPLSQLGLRDASEIEDDIDGFDIVIVTRDEFGNVVLQLGSEKSPTRYGNPYFSEPTAFEELISSPLFWIGTAVVVGAGGALVYAFAIAPPERVGVVSSTR